MKMRSKQVPAVGLTLVAMAISQVAHTGNGPPPTQLSDQGVAVVPVTIFDGGEGAVGCDAYGTGFTETVFDFDGGEGEGCEDSPMAGITCQLDEDEVLAWQSANFPINFVAMEQCVDEYGGSCIETFANVHYYPAPGGVTSDSNVTLIIDGGEGLPVEPDFVTFCSGQDADSVEFGSTIPDCSETAAADLCPSAGQVLIDVTALRTDGDPELFQPQANANTCVCNSPGGNGLLQCDPIAPAEDPNGCPDEDVMNAQTEEVIETSNDPYVCRTVGGKRKCWSY